MPVRSPSTVGTVTESVRTEYKYKLREVPREDVTWIPHWGPSLVYPFVLEKRVFLFNLCSHDLHQGERQSVRGFFLLRPFLKYCNFKISLSKKHSL